MEIIKLVQNIVDAADDKKAQDIKVLDLREVSSVTDFLLFVPGRRESIQKLFQIILRKNWKKSITSVC